MLIVSGLNVPSVVLIEVIKLVVDVDGAFDGVWRSLSVVQQVYNASLRTLSYIVPLLKVLSADGSLDVIRDYDLLDLIRHHVEDDSCCQENDCEDRESQRRRHRSRHGAPGWQCLLLELGLFEAFNFLSNGLFISCGDLHIV